MGADSFEELRRHIGHEIKCVCYGEEGQDPHNVSIECETCGEVLLDFDSPDIEDAPDISKKGFWARYYTIKRDDVGQLCIKAFGRAWPVSDFLGRVLYTDVGKRVRRVRCDDPRAGYILQVESDDQFAKRLAAERKGK